MKGKVYIVIGSSNNMVYIYEKIIGKVPYYYLRLNIVKNGKMIVKDIAYLGNDMSKINVESLMKNSKYKEEIKKSYKTISKFVNSKHYLKKAEALKLKADKYLTEEQKVLLESIRLHFKDRFLKLDKQTQKEVYDNFIVSFAYNTTSIEGNTIPLKETAEILNEGITPKNRELREIYDLRNTKDTFFWILEQKKLNKELIGETHDRLLKDVDLRLGFRNHDIRVLHARFKAAPFFMIDEEIDYLLKWLDENKETNLFALATMFHHRFEKIHPFSDGNGRTGRILFNWLLIKNNYPPLIITKKNRDEYLTALEASDKRTDYKPLIDFLLKEYEKGYWDNFNV